MTTPAGHGVQATQAGHGVQATQAGHGVQATQAGSTKTRRGFEAWSWLFMRLSGLALIFLALLHFAITHILNDVVHTDYRFVADRWDNPAWQLFDWLLLALALLHGANGARWVIEDYIRAPRAQASVKAVVYVLSAALLLFGTFTIVSFDAVP